MYYVKSMLQTLKQLFSFHMKYKFWVFLTFFLVTLIAITTSLYPYFFQFYIDNINAGKFSNLIPLTIAFLFIIFMDNILDVLIWLAHDKFIIRSSRDVTLKIFKHVQDLDFAFHTEKNTGALISAFKRGSGAFFSITEVLQEIYRLIILFGILLVSYWMVNPKYTLVTLILLVINLIAMRFLIPLNISRRVDFVNADDKVSGIITENWLNYDTVKLFAQEDSELRNLTNTFKDWYRKIWSFSYSFRFVDLINTALNFTGYAVIMVLLISDLKHGTISTGQFALILVFLNRFFGQVRRLFYRLRNIAKNYADIKKFFALLDEETKVPDPVKPKRIKNIRGEIEFKNVSFSYNDNENKALRNINLDIKPGEAVALVGRSGSGKTTITKLLLRFYDPQEGIISLDGIDIREMKKQYLRHFMGVVPQEPILFNNTIAYNIGYGLNRPTKQMIKAAAKMAHLDKFIESLPDGYNTMVGERGIKLSGGQRQRLAIARMILSQPNIIIFDEATSNLDSESEKLIQDAFWKVRKGKTTIIIAHRLSTIQRADRIIVLDRGKIVEEGTHQELVKNSSHYQKLWKLQTEGLIK